VFDSMYLASDTLIDLKPNSNNTQQNITALKIARIKWCVNSSCIVCVLVLASVAWQSHALLSECQKQA